MKPLLTIITCIFLATGIVACGKIDPEKDSSANSTNAISAYDRNGVPLGKIISADIMGSNTISVFNSSTSALWVINYGGGFLLVGSSSLSQFDCYYESTDCSGVCYINNSLPKNIVVVGPSSTFFKATVATVSKTANSGFLGAGTNTCTALGTPLTTTFKVSTPYQFPTGVTYPFPMPIYFE